MRLTLFSLLLAACTATSADAIVGSWRRLPSSLDPHAPAVADRLVTTFGDDGTFQTREPGYTSSGTYAVTDGRIVTTTVEDTGASHTVELPFLVDADRLVLGTLDADDDGADPVATWSGYAVYDGARVDTVVSLEADASAHMIQTQGDTAPATYDGTWRSNASDVAETYVADTGSGTLTILRSGTIYAGALGEPYERVE